MNRLRVKRKYDPHNMFRFAQDKEAARWLTQVQPLLLFLCPNIFHCKP
ncbi:MULTISPECIES: BBE domain-containing protein [Paenibacillus]